ncbi:asparagine synthase (glutamine-hydrolyzing) [Aliiglaciecola litoralis]|uniref:asparagine synthase (glutamine-hydrolyzing) n=1 Tax=Aliiglaciecola litoralis TaxID=582857 RepID=A0ABN1LDA4_9ALTE
MCGVSFIWNKRAEKQVLQSKIKTSLEKLAHRGPDSSCFAPLANGFIGHTRLSIIDLDASQQPMLSPCGRYSLAFNGEIYNYKEQREKLQNLWSFKTNGDTEVLLAGLVLFGVKYLEQLEGMWGFVFWDEQDGVLFLGRDRMGKKPLYYQDTIDTFSCCSELPALSVLSDDKWTEDLSSTADYFRYGFYLPGFTAYEQVKEVKPGHILRWTPGVKAAEEPYWRLKVSKYQGTKSNAVEDLRNALDYSVKRRLVSDVDVGSFLSGGVDSSIITALGSRHHIEGFKTFTVGFDSKSYDERKYARQVSEHLKTDLYEYVLESFSREDIEKLLGVHIGQPFFDSSILPTSKVAELASQHVKVALSGDGGDELFCGYQRYKARALINHYKKLPKLLQQQVARMIRLMPEPSAHHSGSLLKKAHMFLDVVDRQGSETPFVSARFFTEHQFNDLLPGLSSIGHHDDRLIEDAKPNEVVAMMFNDAHIYLPQDIHTKVDRASMSHSLETRAPFMDQKVVELAFSFPLEWQLSWKTNKPILYEAFRDLLPENIWKRRKQGFAVPIGEWFRGDMGLQFIELLEGSESQFINIDALKALYHQHLSGVKDNGHRLWLFYVYLLWRKTCPWLA